MLERYQRDYERDRPGLVSDSLGLIWAARRGLSETELLHLLRPADLPQLPLATWSPLRAALEEGMMDRGGILNFAHDFLRSSVEVTFVPNENRRDELRLQLADEFEQQPISARSCDELPWLLHQTKQNDRLFACLLDVDRFLEIIARDKEELRRYWVDMGEERTMGGPYLASFEEWSKRSALEDSRISHAASELGNFLMEANLCKEAEPLCHRALAIDELKFGPNHPQVALDLNYLAVLLERTHRLAEQEPLLRRALEIDERSLGASHPAVARDLDNLACLLQDTNRLAQAEQLYRRALVIREQRLGPSHYDVGTCLNNIADLLKNMGRLEEAEQLMRRALAIAERSCGPDHPQTSTALNNLAVLLDGANRLAEAEPLMRRALAIADRSCGPNHPIVATRLNNLASIVQGTSRQSEAEPLMLRALGIYNRIQKETGHAEPIAATCRRNLRNLRFGRIAGTCLLSVVGIIFAGGIIWLLWRIFH